MSNLIAPYKFDIRTNKADQRVVIIDDGLTSANFEAIAYEDFDAVIYTTTNIKLLYDQFTLFCSTFTHNAFQFKPVFFNPEITERPLISSGDGLTNDINSQVLIDEVVRIKARMLNLGFKIFFNDESFWNIDRQFYAFCRYCLTRADRLPEMEIVKGSPFGYLHPILFVMLKGLGVTPHEFLSVRSKLVGELDYLTKEDLVAIVHVCPKCLDKGLIYHETCPKCGSIDVVEQHLLHHFRCANISPETSYMRDGKLICPKCLRELRHIGVDYDRPTTSYTCNKCSVNFSQAKVVCECESCLTKSNIETLVPIPLFNVGINQLGKKMLALTNEFTYSDDTAKFIDILSMNQFKDILRVRLRIFSNKNASSDHSLRVYRATLISAKAMDEFGPELVRRVYEQIPHAMIAVKDGVLFVAVERSVKLTEGEVKSLVSSVLSDVRDAVRNVDFLEYELGVDVDTFLNNL